MFRCLRISVLAAACLAMALSLPVAAAPLGWSTPTQVLSGTFFEISAAVDSTDAVHIAAAGRNGLWYITNRGGSWVGTRILTNPTNKHYMQPSIALDSNDRVFIAFARSSCDDCAPGSSDGVYLLTDKGRTRGTFAATPTKLAPSTSAEPSLAVGGGHIYLAYQSACCEPGPLPPLWFKTNASGSWTTAQITGHGDSPSLKLASNGRVRVAYAKSTGIGFAAATTTTGSFSHTTLPGTGGSDGFPDLALASNNAPNIVWQHGNISTATVRFSRRISGTWTAPADVATSSTLDSASLTLDSTDHPEVAIGTDPGSVRVARLASGVWTFTTVTAADPLDVVIARGTSGKLAVVYSRDGGGIFVTTM